MMMMMMMTGGADVHDDDVANGDNRRADDIEHAPRFARVVVK